MRRKPLIYSLVVLLFVFWIIFKLSPKIEKQKYKTEYRKSPQQVEIIWKKLKNKQDIELTQYNIEILVNGLKKGKQLSQYSRESLKILGPKAIPFLVKILENDGNRYYAALALAEIGKPSLAVLIPLLENSSADEIQKYIVLALGIIGEESIPSILPLLKHPSWEIRRRAALALGATGNIAENFIPDIAKLAEDAPQDIRKDFILALGKMGEKAIPLLMKWLQTPSIDIQYYSALALGEIGEKAILPLSLLMQEPSWETRRRAVLALAKIGNAEKLIPNIVKLIEDAPQNIRGEFILALGEMGPGAVPFLSKMFRYSDPQTRECVAWALLRNAEHLISSEIVVQYVYFYWHPKSTWADPSKAKSLQNYLDEIIKFGPYTDITKIKNITIYMNHGRLLIPKRDSPDPLEQFLDEDTKQRRKRSKALDELAEAVGYNLIKAINPIAKNRIFLYDHVFSFSTPYNRINSELRKLDWQKNYLPRYESVLLAQFFDIVRGRFTAKDLDAKRYEKYVILAKNIVLLGNPFEDNNEHRLFLIVSRNMDMNTLNQWISVIQKINKLRLVHHNKTTRELFFILLQNSENPFEQNLIKYTQHEFFFPENR